MKPFPMHPFVTWNRPIMLGLAGIFFSTPAFAESKAVWAPLYDQGAIGYYSYCPNNVCPTTKDNFNHPDFWPGQTQADRENIVYNALVAAYKKGVRTIDINYYAGPSNIYQPAPGASPAVTAAQQANHNALVEQGDIFVREVNKLNNSVLVYVNDYMKLRIRVNANRNVLDCILYRTDRTGHAGAQYDAIPHAMDMDLNGNLRPGGDPFLVDLSSTTVAQYISDYTRLVLNAIWPRLSPLTKIESVALSLDAGGESSTTSIGGGYPITYFADSPYPLNGTFTQKVSHYRTKEFDLRVAYSTFANAVHGFNQSLKAAAFLQTWAFDARYRSGFDGASLLKYSGMDFLHHTHPPKWWTGVGEQVVDYGTSLRWAAYSSSVARALGKGFDTEFSWAWYVTPQIDINSWSNRVPSQMTDPLADAFYFQAAAGFLYGATGFTYAAWSEHEFTTPPNTAEWGNLLGKSSPWDATHLTRTGSVGVAQGLFNYAPWPSARKAIYVSTLGRVKCEEDGSCFAWGPSQVYLQWFNNFGINFGGERVDIITDQMIKDHSSLSALTAFLNQYDTVYFPFETGSYVDRNVYSSLYNYWAAGNQNKLWMQSSAGSTVRGNFGNWLNMVDRSLTSF